VLAGDQMERDGEKLGYLVISSKWNNAKWFVTKTQIVLTTTGILNNPDIHISIVMAS